MARQVVDSALRRYFEARHSKVDTFVDTHFTFLGSLRLHRHAVGLDLLRGPVNIALMVPFVATKLAAKVAWFLRAERVAEWLSARPILLRTAVDREIEWLIHAELLELPFTGCGRYATRDAIADEILSDQDLYGAIADPLVAIGLHSEQPGSREKMTAVLGTYAGTRAATSELAGALINLGTGVVGFNQFTPTAFSLGPALAGLIAQKLAISSFPMGAALGGMWYDLFPASPSALLVGATAIGLVATTSILAAFTGVLADPFQRRLGFHQRRLHRMLDVLERRFRQGNADPFVAREIYVARLLDLVDVVRAVGRALT